MKTESLIKPPLSKVLKSGRVVLAPGEEIGEHVTDKREELIVVLRGEATFVTDAGAITLGAGEVNYVKEGVKHNVKNNSDAEVEYVYVVSLFD